MPRTQDKRATRPAALLLVAALVPLIVFAVAATFVSLRSERAVQEEDALGRARRISALVDAELQRQLDLIAALARLPVLDTPANLPAFAEVLRREEAAQPLWLTAMLADPEGNVLLYTRVQRQRVVDLESFLQVVRQRVPLVGNVSRGIAGLALPVRAPVMRDGQLRSVIVVAIRPDAIRERLLTAQLPAEWTGAVIDTAGRVVARTRGDETMLAAPASAGALAARVRASEGIYQGQSLENVPTVSAFYVSPATGWSVHVAIPRALFTAPLLRATWLAAAGGAVSLALAATFLTLLLRELRLRRREAAMLESAQRLEALGRLTGGVAHDFNNLLTVVSGNLELLERRVPSAATERSVAAIRGAVERGVSLTRGLLTFSRSGLSQGSVEYVNPCIRSVFGMMREAIGPGVETELDLQEQLPPVRVDRVQFDLALLNLAANAQDAMPKGGTLRIATRRVTLDGNVPGVAVSVADTGVGIPADILSRVFEPFFTTKEIGRGTGLGLAQVYGFALNAGGQARIASRSGVGTTVTILLPATTAPIDAPPPPDEAQCGLLSTSDPAPRGFSAPGPPQ